MYVKLSKIFLYHIFSLFSSLGMLKEAEIIEQQMMLSRGGGLATGRGVGGVAQPDYSAQWAEYYRSVFVTKLMLWGPFSKP